jgi:hypothetical protein
MSFPRASLRAFVHVVACEVRRWRRSLGLVLFVACGGVPSSPISGSGKAVGVEACLPGVTQMCLGPGACRGAQSCLTDGSGFGACDCGTGSSGAGTGASLGSTGSASGVSSGASANSGTIFQRFDDAGTGTSTAALVPDGTTGLACTTDADCIGDGGAGINRCSRDYQGTFTAVDVTEFATPVCIIPPAAGGNCDPGTVADQIQFCDGDPNDPSSPGVCVPLNPTAPMTDQGVCLPKCTFLTDGSAATGCPGKDACSFNTYVAVPDATADAGVDILGIGICQSACRTTADCAALGSTYSCEPDIGECTPNAPLARTKMPGDACTTADTTSGACFCATGSGTSGFCTLDCVIGATPSDCPSGWVCDTGEPTILDFGPGSPTFPPLTKQTSGAIGICLPVCTSAEAGAAASEASAAVPGGCPGTSSMCSTGDIAGPDCTPQ